MKFHGIKEYSQQRTLFGKTLIQAFCTRGEFPYLNLKLTFQRYFCLGVNQESQEQDQTTRNFKKVFNGNKLVYERLIKRLINDSREYTRVQLY